jgi:hypothetical protein
MRGRAKNSYDFYNVIEKSVLEMEGASETSERQMSDEVLMQQGGLTREELNKLVQQIRVLSMMLQRHKPAEWNELYRLCVVFRCCALNIDRSIKIMSSS